MNLKQTYIFISKFFLVSALTASSFHQDAKPQEYQSCLCVPFWQCKDDLSELIYDNVKIENFRVLRKYGKTTIGQCSGYFDACCRFECGRNNLGASTKDINFFTPNIHGGKDTEFGEYPWMLAITRGKVYKCGASLIHPQVAITAAHCVDEYTTFKVRAGEWNLKTRVEALPYQVRLTEKVIIHPQYNPKTLTNDLALLILDVPFKLAENVGIVCLAPSTYRKNTAKCTVTGWGKNNSSKEGTYQFTLKKLDIPLMPSDQCEHELRNAKMGWQFNLHRSFLCAGDGSKDACKGDGGCPLFCEVEGEQGRYEQVGIVSWGLTCGVFKTPGVYVNVALFVKWIDAEMEKHKFDKNIYKY